MTGRTSPAGPQVVIRGIHELHLRPAQCRRDGVRIPHRRGDYGGIGGGRCRDRRPIGRRQHQPRSERSASQRSRTTTRQAISPASMHGTQAKIAPPCSRLLRSALLASACADSAVATAPVPVIPIMQRRISAWALERSSVIVGQILTKVGIVRMAAFHDTCPDCVPKERTPHLCRRTAERTAPRNLQCCLP